MLIWALAMVLFLVFGALGYAKGAVRTLFPLLGLFVAVLLALPLAPVAQPLVPLVGLTNPIWSVLLPPLIVFFLVELVFIGIGFVVHWRLGLYFKYRTDEHQFVRWLRLNQRVGACMGLAAGAVYTLLIGLVVYVLGYLTVQVSAGDSDPAAVRYLNHARQDLRSSGLENAVAAFDPAPAVYYEAADVLGLLYHNPLLDGRLSAYPPFLILTEQPEFQEIVNDSEYKNLLKSHASVRDIINHAQTQKILANPALLEQLRQIDLRDLYDYLKTGESAKYQDQPILGRWELDYYGTLLEEKKRRARMTSSEMRELRLQMELIRRMRLVIAPDNSVRLKGPDVSGVVKDIRAAATRPARPAVQVMPAPVQPSAQPSPSYSPQMAERYGMAQRGVPTSPAGQPGSPGAPAAPPAPPPMTLDTVAQRVAQLSEGLLAQGNWRDNVGRYEVSVRSRTDLFFFGQDTAGGAQALIRDDGKLYLTRNRQTVVMQRYF